MKRREKGKGRKEMKGKGKREKRIFLVRIHDNFLFRLAIKLINLPFMFLI